MQEVLIEYGELTRPRDESRWVAKVMGRRRDDGSYEAWIEFLPIVGGEAYERVPLLRTQRETTQPDRSAALYWASGLTRAYLEGALERADERSARIG